MDRNNYSLGQLIDKEKCVKKHEDKCSLSCQIQDWDDCYKMAYLATVDTKLRELQNKVLNCFVPTNKWLCIRKLCVSDSCSFCDLAVEDIGHLF